MSTASPSAQAEAALARQPEVQPADPQAAKGEAHEQSTVPAKRGRGRPKGSKNRKEIPASATAGPSTTPAGDVPKKKRGRPPKDKPHVETQPKRKRGRPRKNPEPAKEANDEDAEGEEVPTKRAKPASTSKE